MNNEFNYPDSCEGCPNNQKNYSMSMSEHQSLVQVMYEAYIAEQAEFNDKYIDEMGGNDGIASKEEWDDLDEEHY